MRLYRYTGPIGSTLWNGHLAVFRTKQPSYRLQFVRMSVGFEWVQITVRLYLSSRKKECLGEKKSTPNIKELDEMMYKQHSIWRCIMLVVNGVVFLNCCFSFVCRMLFGTHTQPMVFVPSALPQFTVNFMATEIRYLIVIIATIKTIVSTIITIIAVIVIDWILLQLPAFIRLVRSLTMQLRG